MCVHYFIKPMICKLKSKNTCDISDIPLEFRDSVIKIISKSIDYKIKYGNDFAIATNVEELDEVFINNYILTVSQLFVRSNDTEIIFHSMSFSWNKKRTILTANITSSIKWSTYSNEEGTDLSDNSKKLLDIGTT